MRAWVITIIIGCAWPIIGAAGTSIVPNSDLPPLEIPPSKLVHFDSAIRIPHQYMVKFKDDATLATDISGSNISVMKIAPNLLPNYPDSISRLAHAISAAYQQKEGTANSLLGIWTAPGGLRGFGIKDISESDIAELAQDPRVEFIEPDMYAQTMAVQIESTGVPGCSGNCAPWQLDRLDSRSGLDGLYHFDSLGYAVYAYIIDTGVQPLHTEFSNSFIPPFNLFRNYDCTNNATGCVEFVSSDNTSYDCNGHGTAVASQVSGTNFGVAKGAVIQSMRASVTSSDCTQSLGANAIVNALQQIEFDKISRGIGTGGMVVNMSFMFSGQNQLVDNEVNNVITDGVSVVVAAGQASSGLPGNSVDPCYNTPQRNSRAIRVGATDSSDTRWNSSNYGVCVDIFAPGVYNYTASNGAVGSGCPGGFPSNTAVCNALAGTSLSAPIVAGVAALYLQNYPNADPATVKNVILANATAGAIHNVGGGSPNLLAYIGVPGNSSVGVVGSGGGGITPSMLVVTIVGPLML